MIMGDLDLVKAFCEENYELFQRWLDDRDIESTEAEVILENLGANNGKTPTSSEKR